MSAELDLRAVLEGKRRQKSPSNFVNVNGSPLRRIVDDDDNRPISPRRSRSRNRSRSRSAGSPSKQRDWMEPERPLPLLPSSPSRINVDEILLLEQEVERSQREIDRKIAENERRQQEIVNLQMDALEETEEMTMPRDDVASLGSLPSEDETTIPMALDIDEGGPELSHLDEEREKSPGFDTVEDGSDEPAPPGEEDTKRDRVKKSVSASDGANEEKNKMSRPSGRIGLKAMVTEAIGKSRTHKLSFDNIVLFIKRHHHDYYERLGLSKLKRGLRNLLKDEGAFVLTKFMGKTLGPKTAMELWTLSTIAQKYGWILESTKGTSVPGKQGVKSRLHHQEKRRQISPIRALSPVRRSPSPRTRTSSPRRRSPSPGMRRPPSPRTRFPSPGLRVEGPQERSLSSRLSQGRNIDSSIREAHRNSLRDRLDTPGADRYRRERNRGSISPLGGRMHSRSPLRGRMQSRSPMRDRMLSRSPMRGRIQSRSPMRGRIQSRSPMRGRSPMMGQSPPRGVWRSPPRGAGRSPPRGVWRSPPPGVFRSPPREGNRSPPPGAFRSPPREGYRSPPPGAFRSPPRVGYRSPPRDVRRSPPPRGGISPLREAYGSPVRMAYRSPPRDIYRSPPQNLYGSPPREAYRSPPRVAHRSPPRGVYRSPGREAYQGPVPVMHRGQSRESTQWPLQSRINSSSDDPSPYHNLPPANSGEPHRRYRDEDRRSSPNEFKRRSPVGTFNRDKIPPPPSILSPQFSIPPEARVNERGGRGKPQQPPQACLVCQSTAHRAKECPELVCFNCQQGGHFASECTNPTVSRPVKDKPKEGNRSALSSKTMECYNCGNIGHSIKSCPKLDCKKCGATGHFAKECQNAPNQFKPRSNTAQGASFASGSAASAEAPKVWSQPSQAVAKQNKSLLSFFCEKLLGAGHSALLADQMMITWKMAGHNEETLKTLVFKENPKTQAQLRLALVKELSNVKAGHIPRSVNVSSLLDETVNYFMPNSDFGTWTDASRSNSGYFDGTLRLQAGTEQRQQQQPPPPNFQSSRPENFGNNFVGSGGQQPPSQPQGMSSFFHPGDNRQPNPTSFRSQPQVKEEQQDDDEIQIIHQSLPPSRDQMRPMQSSAGGGPQIPGPASILDLETALQNINSLERFKQLDETIQRETRQDPQLLNEFEGRHQSLAPLQKFVASRMRVMSDMFGMSESYIFTVSSTIQKLMAHVGLCLFTLKRMFMTYGRESLQDTIEEKLRPYSHSFPKGITVKYIVNMVNDFLLEFSRN